MLLRSLLAASLVFAALALVGCSSKSATSAPPAADNKDNKDNPLSDPKKSIEHQMKLLKDGDVDKLKACFTARQQERVTKEAVAAAQKNADKFTIDDLVSDVVLSETGGVKQAKITMKNKKTLTTLILTDGKWLSDTIWFR